MAFLTVSLPARIGVGNLGLSVLAKRAEEKHDRLQERLTQIEKANVDRWQEGYAAAERRIVAWLRAGQGIAWEPASLQIADAIECAAHKEDRE